MKADVHATSPRLIRLGSSLREIDPHESRDRARALMRVMGISRVTDITRMDRLGLAVFIAIRPRAMVLRVHSGKGLRSIDAEVGALMEAIELAVAEPAGNDRVLEHPTLGRLESLLGNGLRLVEFAPRFGVDFDRDAPIEAVHCEEIGTDRHVLLPAELIFVPFVPTRGALFGWTGNGLASGNSVEEATLHGLLEVLERDALALHRVADRSSLVDPDSYPADFARSAKAWHAMGVRLAVRMIPNDCSFPCFEAFLHEPESTDVNLARGSGLHVDLEIAFARAVCEAAQSRLNGIHGGREDITRYFTKYGDRADDERRRINEIFDATRTIDLRSVPRADADVASLADCLTSVRERMRAAGLPTIYRYLFPSPSLQLSVVKIIVPRCEEDDSQLRRVGPRLARRIMLDA